MVLADGTAATKTPREVLWESYVTLYKVRCCTKRGHLREAVPKWSSVDWIMGQKRMPPLHPSCCLSQVLRLTWAPGEPFPRPWQAASPLSAQSPFSIFLFHLNFLNLWLLTTSPLCLVNLYLFSQNHPQRFTRGITSFGNILGPIWPRLLQ